MNLLAAGQALTKHTSIEGGIPFAPVITSMGESKLISLEHLLRRPSVTRAQVNVNDAASFIGYVNRFMPDRSTSEACCAAIFVSVTETGASFTAVLDYHHDRNGGPERGEHRVVYVCEPTPEWKRWTAGDKERMSQADFARLLEDNAPDIVTPSSATMLEIALSLEARTAGDFSSATRLDNGALQFRYSENIEAKAGLNGNVEIPAIFEIGIAPFTGFAAFKVQARLRYRLNSGKLTFWYELVRTHKIIEVAAQEIIDKITEQTAITPFRGSVISMGLKG